MKNCVDWAGQGCPSKVVFWDGDGMTPEAVLKHVNSGGGCIAGMCPWGYLQLNRGKTLADNPINKAFSKMGLVLVDGYYEGKGGVYSIADSKPDVCTAQHVHECPGASGVTEEKVFPLEPDHMVESSAKNIAEARVVVTGAGWWAPVSKHSYMVFDFHESICLTAIEVLCANPDACPKTLIVTDAETNKEIQRCPYPTNNKPGGGNEKVAFAMPHLKIRRLRLDFVDIYNGQYMGINRVRIRHQGAKSRTGMHTLPLLFSALTKEDKKDMVSSVMRDVTRVPTPDKPMAITAEIRPTMHIYCKECEGCVPGAECFPGAASGPSVTVEGVVESEGFANSLQFAFCYANPGTTITISVIAGDPSQWSYQIGCHSDDTSNHDQWKRWPIVTTCGSLSGVTTNVCCKFGGLVYLVPNSDRAPPLHFTVQGAFGEATAPWWECAGKRIILTLPASTLRKFIHQVETALQFWDRVVESHHDLATPPYGYIRKERVVVDVSIFNGYMHSGYPIMAHLDLADRILDVQKMFTEGDWGLFHELGHNMQRDWWTWGATTEVTVNLFTLYTMENVVTRTFTHFDFWHTKESHAMIEKFMKDGRPYAVWAKEPFLALYTYALLVKDFSWNAFKTVFKDYERNPPQNLVTDEDKNSEWMVRFSTTVGRDLSTYLESWGLPVSATAKQKTAGFPKYSPPQIPLAI
jgi:hypothetical protein